jgi:predicted RNA-binding protein with PIN domain
MKTSSCYLVIGVRYNARMPLLIDGHNLIGQIPGLSLADPDDEGDLVMLLRRYTTAQRGRKVVVVFDHGVYGHPQTLDGYGVSCYFARSPQDADAQLIKRIRALKRPRDWTLVTSDRQIARAAEEHGVRVISSHVFARQLLAPARPAATQEEQRDIRLSEAEIEKWLRLFGEEPDE